jgi:GMP synthase-like glutamine amidotransferase
MEQLKLALMDMNNGVPNQGMRGLRNIIKNFERPRGENPGIKMLAFEVRQKHEIPDLSYDIYLASGGPGDPRENSGTWEKHWYQLVDKVWRHNQTSQQKKYFFFVCHSFQMACQHFGLCDITRRKSTSFGIYPIHKTEAGKKDPLLKGLMDPYYGVDSRDWQLVQPKSKVFKKYGAKILCLEKIRTHVELERAIMAVRFTPEMIGTQFHPEADPKGMIRHFKDPVNREKVIKNFNKEKYEKMMGYLDNPETILHTYHTVIPGFLERATESLIKQRYNEHAA